MNKKISVWLTDWCRQFVSIEEEVQAVIRYGIEVWLNSSVKIILLLLIGSVCGCFIETVVVLFIFGRVRKYAGGVHCKTDAGCFFSMFLLCAVSIGVSKCCGNIPLFFLYAGMIISWVNIWKFAPCNSKVNPITDKKILEQKRKDALLIITGFSIFILLLPSREWQWLVFSPVFIETLTILPLVERRGTT